GNDFGQTDSRTLTIAPANSQHYDLLIRALQTKASLPDRIAHAWSVTRIHYGHADSESFTAAQPQGFYSLLFLARALAACNIRHEIMLLALSDTFHDVLGVETLRPEKATLLGPCMVTRQEYPNIRMKSIDLDT